MNTVSNWLVHKLPKKLFFVQSPWDFGLPMTCREPRVGKRLWKIIVVQLNYIKMSLKYNATNPYLFDHTFPNSQCTSSNSWNIPEVSRMIGMCPDCKAQDEFITYYLVDVCADQKFLAANSRVSYYRRRRRTPLLSCKLSFHKRVFISVCMLWNLKSQQIVSTGMELKFFHAVQHDNNIKTSIRRCTFHNTPDVTEPSN